VSETKFTKGPWRAEVYSEDECEVVPQAVINYGELMLYDGNRAGNGECCKMTAANAHLIAAAPELYEALAELVRIHKTSHVTWDDAELALAKARGEGCGNKP